MKYYITPTHCIAQNHKVASSSVAAAIAEKFYPDIFSSVTLMPVQYRFLIPTTEKPDKPVAILIREPIERFKTAVATVGCTVDEAFERMNDVHFVPQSSYVNKDSTVYLFPRDIDKFCADVGLDKIPYLNEAQNEMPELTDDQLVKVKEYYKHDIELFKGASNG